MKKTNKGFSMVELIIVIAIMAILAGALAPALIKYINKSRLSTDIQTANSIATGVQTALATEKGFDDASACSGKTLAQIYALSGSNSCAAEIADTCGKKNIPTPKAKKCLDKTAGHKAYGGDFVVEVDAPANVVEIYVVTGSNSHQLYPAAESCVKD